LTGFKDEKVVNSMLKHPALRWLWILTIIVAMIPLLIYGFERATGQLPSEKEWDAEGFYPGPWSLPRTISMGEIYEADVMLYCWFISLGLAVINLLTAIYLSIANKRALYLLDGVLLIILLAIFLYWQAWTMLWTID
jgi:hypothetical protein